MAWRLQTNSIAPARAGFWRAGLCVEFLACVVVMAATILVPARQATAAEPYLEFIDGLRARGYFDTALDYLDQIEQRPDTPADVKTVIAYQRAQTLQQGAQSLVSLEERRLQLDRAEQELSRFVAASAGHPLAARANYDRARIMLGRAQVDIWDAAASDEGEQKTDQRSRARKYLGEARGIIVKAIDQNRAKSKEFPTFISEADKAQRAARDEVLNRLMESQLAAAEITYWEARSYDQGTPLRRQLLEKAVKDYESIVQQYRDSSAGTYATLWQGKCYEELGDITEALGIFKDVLQASERESDDVESVRALKDLALRFRLICLNHDERKDYPVVVEEADAWLRDHRDRAATDVGLGIQWESARALETLGSDRSRSESQRRGDLNSALERAREISRFGGEYKVEASRMAQRVMLALDKKGGDSRDFASAYASATALMDESKKLNDSYRQALSKGDATAAANAQRAIKGAGDQMARLFTQALRHKTANTEPDKVVSARLQLGYAYFLQGRFLDCAAIADRELRQQKIAFPELAREAGFLGMSALEASIGSSLEDHAVESEWLQQIGERLISTWPTSDRAQEARMVLGRTAWNQNDFPNAAKWWSQVPLGAAQYPAAQISSGQASWRQYVKALQGPESERPAADQLRDWKQQATKHLEEGIEHRQRGLTGDSSTPDDLVLGKITLAQLRNLDGQFHSKGSSRGSIEVLTKGPHDVMSAVKAPLKGERPNDPGRAQSAQVASLAYQQLLRSYIGVKDLDAAKDVREDLEALSGSTNPEALTAIYVEFGRELQRELQRLEASGEADRAAETRKGFEEFLTSLTGRTDGQSFSSLLWIAETLSGLAEGAGKAAGAGGFSKSAEIYEQMLARADEPGFLPEKSYKNLLLLHLAMNQRRTGEFATAEESLNELLKGNPTAPDVQAEAARLYTDWGVGDSDESKLKLAIAGRRGGASDIWGWNATVSRLQKEAATRPSDQMTQLLVDARYNLASAEFALAKQIDDDAERDRHLALARHAIFAFVRATKAATDTDHARFDELYRQVLAERGDPIKALPRDPKTLVAEAPPPKPADVKQASGGGKTVATAAGTKAASGSQTSVVLVSTFIAAGLLSAGAILFMMMRQIGSKRQRIAELGRAASPGRKAASSE
jgi:cellulose synthase operon protein C